MATLSVLKFPTVDGAQQMESTLLDLQKQSLIEVQDAAIVTWPQGKKKPTIEELHSLAGHCALMGKFDAYEIDEIFTRQTRERVTEGTSALLLVTSGAVLNAVVAAAKDRTFEVISMSLPEEKGDELRATRGAK